MLPNPHQRSFGQWHHSCPGGSRFPLPPSSPRTPGCASPEILVPLLLPLSASTPSLALSPRFYVSAWLSEEPISSHVSLSTQIFVFTETSGFLSVKRGEGICPFYLTRCEAHQMMAVETLYKLKSASQICGILLLLSRGLWKSEAQAETDQESKCCG